MTEVTESTITFPYKRSLGPVIGAFMTALTEQRILGIRSGDRVLVPAAGVGSRHRRGARPRLRRGRPGRHGRVVDAGSPTPTEQHPLDHPFAFALDPLDGADTPLLHAVDAGSIDAMSDRHAGRAPLAGRPASATSPTSSASSPARSPRSTATTAARPTEPVTMMDYHASITYTHPGRRRTPMRAEQATAEGRFLGLQCPVCGRVYTGGKGYCPIDAVELTAEHEVDLPQTGTITNYTIVTPVQYPGQTETEPFARVHRPARRHRRGPRLPAAHRRSRRPTCASACASPRCGRRRARRSTTGAHGRRLRQPRRLDPDRRTRRRRPRPREQDLLMAATTPTTSPSSAGRRRRWCAAPTKTETQLLLEVITDALEPLGLTRADVDFTCARQLRLHRRPGVLVRAEPRRHRRVAAEARLARRDGRRVGAVRGVAPPAAGRHRRSRWSTGSGRSSTADPALIYPMEMDPYYLAPLGADPLTLRRAAGPGADRRGHGRPSAQMAEVAVRTRRDAIGNPHAQVSGDVDVDELLADDYVRAPLRRHDLPPITDGAVRDGARHAATGPASCASDPVVDHRLRPPHRVPQPGASATSHDSPSTRIAAEAAGLDDGAGRGRRAAGRVHPRGAAAASRRSASATTSRSTRRAARWRRTRSWPPASSASATPPTTSSDGGNQRTLAHSTSGPCLQQNLVCILEGTTR